MGRGAGLAWMIQENRLFHIHCRCACDYPPQLSVQKLYVIRAIFHCKGETCGCFMGTSGVLQYLLGTFTRCRFPE